MLIAVSKSVFHLKCTNACVCVCGLKVLRLMAHETEVIHYSLSVYSIASANGRYDFFRTREHTV